MDDVERWIVELKSPDLGIEENAAKQLVKLKDVRAIPALIKLLDKFEWQYNAGRALVRIGKLAVTALLEAFKDASAEVREYAVKLLGRISDVAAVPALKEILEEGYRYVERENPWHVKRIRRCTVEALGEIGKANPGNPEVLKAVSALVECLYWNDQGIRNRATEALGKIGGTAAITALIETLKGPGWTVAQRKAAEALGEIGGDSSISALVKAQKDENLYVRLGAAKALLQIGLKESKKRPSIINHVMESMARSDWFLREETKNSRSYLSANKTINELLSKLRAAEGKQGKPVLDRDILLTGRPKPPKHGTIHRKIKKIRNR